MDVSLVIPLKDEEESLPELSEWISRVMNANNFSYEIIFVDDGSTDNSWNIIEELRIKIPILKGSNFSAIMENPLD
jgi:glycosyltransferase involved in cell wall biosynthesis